MQTVYYIILVPMVYAALGIFVIGVVWRGVSVFRGLALSLPSEIGPPERPRVLGALRDAFLFPQTLRSHPVHWTFLVTFHAALLLLVIGHLELITEIRVLQLIPHRVFLGGGVLGIVLILTIVFLLLRRFHAPLREISAAADYYALLLLLLVALFGSQLHLARRLFGYSTIEVNEYREYLTSLFTLRPALPEMFSDGVVGHSFLLVLHVFCASLLLMLFPASPMMHALLAYPLARLRRK